MHTIFCVHCGELILDTPTCAACGWRRPLSNESIGAEIWRIDLARRLHKPYFSPIIAQRVYCLGALNGALVGLDARTGEALWEQILGVDHAAQALASDGERLFVGAASTQSLPSDTQPLLALDPRSGAELWRFPTTAHSLSAATVAGPVVYFTSSDGMLYAVHSASGHEHWSLAHPSWGPMAPAVDDGVVCVGGQSETLIGYSLDGTEVWRYDGGGWFAAELCLVNKCLYTLCWDDYLYAIEARSGRLRWRIKGERGRGFTSAPAIAGDLVFIGSRVSHTNTSQQGTGYAMLALRAEDGSEVWRAAVDQHVFIPPLVAGDTLFCISSSDTLFTLDLKTGAERWRKRLGRQVATLPQVADDLIYIGERRGAVYALRWRPALGIAASDPAENLRHGEIELAAVAYAMRSNFAAAAAIYEQRLNRLAEAARLYERAGQIAKAASLWEALGESRRARDAYIQAGDQRGLARMLERTGELLEAARLYEALEQLEEAARLYETAGDRVLAAELYHRIGWLRKARELWESLGNWERLAEELIGEERLRDAAGVLEQHDQLERAADLYEQASDLLAALRLRVKLEHWERSAALAERVGDIAQAAQAYERLGQTLRAAETYERAAEQLASGAHDSERIAALYELAAQLYDTRFEEERAAACRRQVRYHRLLPEVMLAGHASGTFVEYEWNALQLHVENNGFGPAVDIRIDIHGSFDVSGPQRLNHLLPNKAELLELFIRPHHNQLGQTVPLEISLSYADVRGGYYEATRMIALHVLAKGTIQPPVTPLEIQVNGAQSLGESKSQSTNVTPAGSGTTAGMLDPEEIAAQRELLTMYRRTLRHYLKQQASLGEAYTPPGIINGIYEAREHIRRIKETLARWGIPVERYPDDHPSLPED